MRPTWGPVENGCTAAMSSGESLHDLESGAGLFAASRVHPDEARRGRPPCQRGIHFELVVRRCPRNQRQVGDERFLGCHQVEEMDKSRFAPGQNQHARRLGVQPMDGGQISDSALASPRFPAGYPLMEQGQQAGPVRGQTIR